MSLITLDVFGTVLDWRTGIAQALGRDLTDHEFDRIIDRQGELEARPESYARIVAQSLLDVLAVPAVIAARIGAEAGTWPLFPDSREALRSLMQRAPCAAITNSDVAHGEQVRDQLGFPLTHWVCAERVRAYKPARAMWEAASRATATPFSRDWWHVSAYDDYDHATARALGLTTVLVRRPHCRPGPADVVVNDLRELAALVESRQAGTRSADRL